MPATVADVVEIVSVDEPPEVTDVGENEAVTPDGRPLALSDTDCAAPEVVAVETVAVALAPASTVPLVGLTAIEKSLAAGGRDRTRRAPFGVPRPVGPS